MNLSQAGTRGFSHRREEVGRDDLELPCRFNCLKYHPGMLKIMVTNLAFEKEPGFGSSKIREKKVTAVIATLGDMHEMLQGC